MGSCLSLQCSPGDIRFIPEKCSVPRNKVCENMSKLVIIKSLPRLYIECIVLWGTESGMKH